LYYDICDLEIQLDKHSIRATFDGSVVTADMRAGANARIGSHLGEIINLENLEVEIPLTAEELSWVDNNAIVQFTSEEIPGLWRGKITRVGSTIDRRTQTIPVYVTLDKKSSSGLYDGAYLTASIPGRTVASAFAAPRRAVYSDKFVYLVKDGHLEQRDVVIARQQGDQVIIEGGLVDNDTLVTDILQGVASGMPAVARIKDSDREAN
jgi:membrane fusion protein (multidrug efflux system)